MIKMKRRRLRHRESDANIHTIRRDDKSIYAYLLCVRKGSGRLINMAGWPRVQRTELLNTTYTGFYMLSRR